MYRVWPVSVGVVLTLSLSLPAQKEEAAPKIKRADANKALADYEAALKQARDSFEKETEAARKRLLADLEAAQEKAITARDLNDAIAIRGIRKEHEAATPAPPRVGRLVLPTGKWQFVNAQGPFGTYEFRANGTVLWTEKARRAIGKCTVKDGSILIVYEDDRTERLTPCGPRLLVEHWSPSSSYPAGYPGFAYAEKAK